MNSTYIFGLEHTYKTYFNQIYLPIFGLSQINVEKLVNHTCFKKQKKQTASDSAGNLDKLSMVDVPTKIIASLSKEDQQQANEQRPQPH